MKASVCRPSCAPRATIARALSSTAGFENGSTGAEGKSRGSSGSTAMLAALPGSPVRRGSEQLIPAFAPPRCVAVGTPPPSAGVAPAPASRPFGQHLLGFREDGGDTAGVDEDDDAARAVFAGPHVRD